MKATVRGGVLKDGRGDRIGKIVKAEIEVEDDWVATALQALGGALGGGSVAVGNSQQQPTLEVDGGSGGKEETRTPQSEIEEVWACYVEVMKPRSTELRADERKIIREALKAASPEECRKAIIGCGKSDFHMGKNEQHTKYNKLSQILRGKRGKRTTRENIDFFIDKYEKARGGSSDIPSAPADVINQKKRDVQRGHRFRDDPEKQQRAEEAEAWLKQHGIKVVRGDDGYPTFDFDVTA